MWATVGYIGRSLTRAELMNLFTRDDQSGNGLSNVLLTCGLLLGGLFRVEGWNDPVWFQHLSGQALLALWVLCVGLLAWGCWIRNW